MGLDKTKKKNWVDGDTFAIKITNFSKSYNGKYIILIKSSYDGESQNSNEYFFRAKITQDKIMPTTEKEINELEYIKTNVYSYIQRLFPASGEETLKEAIKRIDSENTYIQDEFGYLNEYIVRLYMKRGIDYGYFIYLGNFNILPPKDEFASKNCKYYLLERTSKTDNNYFVNRLIENYNQYNLRKSIIYTKNGNKEFLQKQKELVELVYGFMENKIKHEDSLIEKYSKENGRGPELYECDLAIKMERDYTRLYNYYMEHKITREELYQQLADIYKDNIDDKIDGPIFWIILADQQYNNNLLTEEQKNMALTAVEKDLNNWKNKSNYNERKKELEMLKDNLNNYDFNKKSNYSYHETKVG